MSDVGRLALLVAIVIAATGCAGELGGIMGPLVGEGTNFGPRAALRVNPFGHEGLGLGAEGWLLSRTSESPFANQWRVALHTGYENLPLKYESAIGVTTGGILTAGHARIGAETPAVLGFGYRLGLPLRLTRRAEPWQSDALVSGHFYLVPDVTLAHLWPVEGPDRGIHHEITFGLALRFQIFSAVQP